MKLSARNQLKGKIVSIDKGVITAKVKLDIGGSNIVTSIISVEAVDDLQLKTGDSVTAIIKSTEVMIGK